MKTLKYFLSIVLFVAAVISCTKDEFGSLDFVSTVVAPTNVTALYNVLHDNTGLVTITPNGKGAVSYNIYFGDETTDPTKVDQGKSTIHTYAEGTYTVKIIAYGITGLKTEVTQELVISFKAPENLEVVIANDLAISRQVNVVATADFATSFEVYFGEEGNDVPVIANIGETASFTYQNKGIYTIRIVAKGAAIETIEYSEVDFEVTAILQPFTPAPAPASRQEVDVVSIYSDTYTNISTAEWNPNWGQSTILTKDFQVGGNNTLKYVNLNYTGIVTDYGNPTNLSSMEFVHFDYWTPDATTIGLKIANTSYLDGDPKKESQVDLPSITLGSWKSVNLPLSDFTTDLTGVTQILFVSSGATVFIDNLYFYIAPTVTSSILDGTWKLAPEAGALGIGPNAGDISWWSNTIDDVTIRACLFDDTYVFNSDGSFSNVLGAETWLETWQGTATDTCGTSIAPHDGSVAATYTYATTTGTVTINGTGAYLGIAKVYNGGELTDPANAPASIVYNATFSNNNTMVLQIAVASGVWQFKLVRVL